jgi:hypothetical protein
MLRTNGSDPAAQQQRQLDGRRDGTLRALAKLLNSRHRLFTRWKDDEDSYVKFMRTLVPWILSPPPYPPSSTEPLPFQVPKWPEPTCGATRYAQVLTGQRLTKPRVIVDFLPFGYDIDKLELRFYESYDLVDAYVVYESPRTNSGIEKPMYFQRLLTDPRFAPFMDKVIYVPASAAELEARVDAVKQSLSRGERYMKRSQSWALEKSMRTEMIQRFNRLNATTSTVKGAIMRRIADGAEALGIQNDADELITGTALLHLRHCEIKPASRAGGIYLPCLAFKKNYHWLQQTTDLVGCMRGDDITATTSPLKGHLWRSGPMVWPLASMLAAGATFRDEGFRCEHHMGLGAASHMSSVAEPTEYWLKRGGVNEQDFHGAIASAIVEAGKREAITPELIFTHTMFPWCIKDKPFVHASTLPREAQEVVNMSIPRLVLLYPGRFPFLLPGHNGDAGTVGLVAAAGDKAWVQKCATSSGNAF